MNVTITSISALNGGSEVALTVRIEEGEHFETRRLVLLARQYAELRPEKGDIDCDKFEVLQSAAEICSAVKRGMYILGYGACSAKQMLIKLRSKGFSRESATSAAEYLCELGYIKEIDDAQREAQKSLKKHWGKRRIAAALIEKGYTREAVAEALDSLDEVDFAELCAELISQRYRGVPGDVDERRKLVASLLRYGYSSSEIKEAITRLGDASELDWSDT